MYLRHPWSSVHWYPWLITPIEPWSTLSWYSVNTPSAAQLTLNQLPSTSRLTVSAELTNFRLMHSDMSWLTLGQLLTGCWLSVNGDVDRVLIECQSRCQSQIDRGIDCHWTADAFPVNLWFDYSGYHNNFLSFQLVVCFTQLVIFWCKYYFIKIKLDISFISFYRALNLCRVFTEMGESFLPVIVESPGRVRDQCITQVLW